MSKTRICKALQELQDAITALAQERHDLLEALEEVMSDDPDMLSHQDTMAKAEALIAEAKHSPPQ